MKVILHLNWRQEGRRAPTTERRRDRYEAIKRRLAASHGARKDGTSENASAGSPLALHAFTYAFLGSAKNVDLFVDADATGVREQLLSLREALGALEAFEREGTQLPTELELLKAPYLRLRRVMLRPGARDERRVLKHVLMTGPATAGELVADLELPSSSGAMRALMALAPVVTGHPDGAQERFGIDESLLPVALFAVRERMGIDPLAVLYEDESLR